MSVKNIDHIDKTTDVYRISVKSWILNQKGLVFVTSLSDKALFLVVCKKKTIIRRLLLHGQSISNVRCQDEIMTEMVRKNYKKEEDKTCYQQSYRPYGM